MFSDDYFEFGKKWLNINAEKVHDGKIVEISFCDTFRAMLSKMSARFYLGISPKDGPGVDKILNPYDVVDFFGRTYFDVVICDLLQYSKDWKRIVWGLKNILNVEGILIIGTRSLPHEREHHSDHWRFTTNILYEAFRGFSIQELKDCPDNGILFIGTKREICSNDISDILADEVN